MARRAAWGRTWPSGCSRKAAASWSPTATRRGTPSSSRASRRSARSPATSPTSRPHDFAEPLAAATVEAFGGIDVVVNNAATYPSHPWNEYTLEEWDRTIDTNLRSLFLMSKATVPHIAARGGGSIVNIGSITFAIGMANILPYVTSKGGLVGFTRALAREVGAQNIRVNNVSPGAFPTGGETIHPDPEGYSRFVIEQQSLKRRGTADDLADTVAFLASERASFITGQMIQVCGGWAFH